MESIQTGTSLIPVSIYNITVEAYSLKLRHVSLYKATFRSNTTTDKAFTHGWSSLA